MAFQKFIPGLPLRSGRCGDTAGSAIRDEGGTKGQNCKGLVTWDRQTKKDAFYFYKAMWAEEPFVRIAGRRFKKRSGETTAVKVYSNCPEVTLTVNGKGYAAQAADSCITLVKDTRNTLPVNPAEKKRVFLVYVGSTPTSKGYKGDAPGDQAAAGKNGVCYYPILVRHEAESWAEFIARALPALTGGEYAPYGEAMARRFVENLQPDK